MAITTENDYNTIHDVSVHTHARTHTPHTHTRACVHTRAHTHVLLSLVQCWSKFGQDNSYPLCSIEMKADMQVALDTETCFRRC